MADFDRNRNFDRKRSRGRFDRRSGGFGGRGGGRDRERNRGFGRQEMHSGICDKCGNECEVPFRPTEGKPLFCDDCFKAKSREAGSRSGFGKKSGENLDQIHKKLDKILRILEGKPVEKEPRENQEKNLEERQPELGEPKSSQEKKPKKKKARKKKS
jgi:CxxC-x17-CxxC domain-containing protein